MTKAKAKDQTTEAKAKKVKDGDLQGAEQQTDEGLKGQGISPGLSAEDLDKDKSFDNRNAKPGEGNAIVHAGNVMPRAVDPDAEYQKAFGMPRAVVDPHAGKVPEGQVNAVANKDPVMPLHTIAEPDPNAMFTKEPEPRGVQSDIPKRYVVSIQPAQNNKEPVRFTNGTEFKSILPGTPTEVSEAIYHAVKDSSIPFSAIPI